MHRWMLRFFAGALLLMIVVFELAPSASRAGYMLATLVALCFVALGLMLIDAWPGVRALPPARTAKRVSPPPASTYAPRSGAKKP